MKKLRDIFASVPEVEKILQANRDHKKISVFGVQNFSRAAISALIGNALVVCSDFFTAGKFASAVRCFSERVVLLKEKDEVLLFSGVFTGSERERITALGDIVTGKADIVVTTAQALMQICPDRAEFEKNILSLEKGAFADPIELSARLSAMGYKRDEQISDACRFSRRGDILDVFPVNAQCPFRIEFFGDEIEKISELDPETQLSVRETERVEIYPFTEVFGFTPDMRAIEKDANQAVSAEYVADREKLISDLATQDERGKSVLLPYAKHMRLIDFCGERTFIADECKRVYDAMEVYFAEHEQRFRSLYEKGQTLSRFFDYVMKPALAAANIAGAAVTFHAVTSSNRFYDPEQLFNFRTLAVPRYVGNNALMIEDVRNWIGSGYKVCICCGNTELRDRIRELFSESHIVSDGDYSGELTITGESAENGEILHEQKLVVIGYADISGKKSAPARIKKRSSFIGEPKIGEYVVHDVHGIGLCEGTTKLTVGKSTRDYVVITYSGGDKLYVPVENMDSLTRYVSGGTPRLNKMGGADFTKQKVKARESIKKLAFDLKELYASRFRADAYRYSEDDSLLREFENTFEFTETDDQLKAVSACLEDLKSPKIMDRLLCGDVGYGKTEVALRVAFKVIAEGKQAAFLSPTTVLAKQHYSTVVRRMEMFGVKTGRLTRFDSPAAVRKTLEALKNGAIDIVVGTHRILSKDVVFKDLGLLILDEEQRFGVGDKEKIKNLKREVNVLTLSATPIPRTLHMSMVGIRDMSLLETPPISRLPVQTYVTEYSEALLYDAVMREMGRGGQIFIVYNRVAHISEFAARVAKIVPDAVITVAHGQMPEGELEKAVDGFVEGKSDILVSSTIIENGIDIPRANTLIVIDADTMGLSQLYQLRGRVGRSNRTAYAFFTFRSNKLLSKESFERLEAIGKYTELGSGFKIAMRDLEIRGAGNILGAEQHGHMEKVGYDMYCSLLAEVLDEMEGKSAPVIRKEVKMTVDYSAYIPDGYITDNEWKLRLYSKVARVNSLKERNTLFDELTDMYGPVPETLRNLINIALIKNLAAGIGASAVVMNKRECLLVYDFVREIESYVHSEALKRGAKLNAGEKPTFKFASNVDLLKFLLKCNELQIKND